MAEGDNGVYHRARCVLFRKTHEQFGGLSNMAGGFALTINAIAIRTSEALYQACRFPNARDVQELIIQQKSPMAAKMLSKPHRHQTRADWESVKVRIMRWCLRLKLAQNWPTFSELLRSTDNRPIVEESHRDDFWGAIPQEEDLLVGKNLLGRLLTELRENVHKLDAHSLMCVEPVPTADFLLLGEPIQAVQAGPALGARPVDPDLNPPDDALWRLPH